MKKDVIIISSVCFPDFTKKYPFWSSYYDLETVYNRGLTTYYVLKSKLKYIDLFSHTNVNPGKETDYDLCNEVALCPWRSKKELQPE